jgi:hypothetical protein
LVGAMFPESAATSANAASLDRLGDGRIALTALGERMYFREKDAKNIQVFWPSYPCKPQPGTSRPLSPSLEEWLDNPVIADCLNEYISNDFVPNGPKVQHALTLKIKFGFADGRLYPGTGKRIDHPLEAALYPGDLEPDQLPSPPLVSEAELRIGDPYTRLACLAPLQNIPNELGYEARGANRTRPPALFTLPPARRQGSTSRPLCVFGGESNWVLLRSADNRVSFSLNWFDWKYSGPRASWSLYDTAARKIANSIFSDRVWGDIQ